MLSAYFAFFYRKIKSGMTVKGFAEMATPLKRLAMTFFIIVILVDVNKFDDRK